MDIVHMPKKYHLGHKRIDMQHEVFFVLFEDLKQSLTRGTEPETIDYIVSGMKTYAMIHFKYEETSMIDTHYQKTDNHIKEHKQMINKASEFKQKLQTANTTDKKTTLAHEIHEFLYKWLTNHINIVDRDLCVFLEKQAKD